MSTVVQAHWAVWGEIKFPLGLIRGGSAMC